MTEAPKPLDLSNLLKHAFICGRVSAGAASSFHSEAWVEYDPTVHVAYHRISAVINRPAPPLSAALELPEVEALLAALETLASYAEAYDPEEGDDADRCWVTEHTPTLGELRKARAALAALGDRQ